MNIGIYIYDDVEVLDFAGPYEVFAVASRLRSGDRVSLIGETGEVVSARNGFRVIPDHRIDDHPRLDVLIVPGGVHTAELGKPAVIDWIRRQAAVAELVASVCTGAFLLAEAGLLDGRPVTTHWEDIADLRSFYPELDVRENVRWLRSGPIATSAGISAGIDMSLALLAELHDEQLARSTARQMEYDRYQPSGRA
jgi:transcriptional regulator GlxA family with amidase domain